jgi:hypothetical protein
MLGKVGVLTVELREIADRPGVFVSPDGRIFVEAAASKSSGGYHTVRVPGRERGKKWVTMRRHTLVAEAFKGPRPFDSAHVRHLDGDPSNDDPSNIKWGTAKENGEDTVAHGRSTRGTKNTQAKLTEDQAREIKRRLARGESGVEIAAEFGLKQPTISNIKTGATWGWLK